MQHILTISGSARQASTNSKLLASFPTLFPQISFKQYQAVEELPLFRASLDKYPWPNTVLQWRKAVADSAAIIVCTPEYIYNLPALLKNALEWVTSSGELMRKPVLALTFTPNPPRGEKAMQSLLWSLQALDARVVGQLALYQQEIKFGKAGEAIMEEEILEMLQEAISMLV